MKVAKVLLSEINSKATMKANISIQNRKNLYDFFGKNLETAKSNKTPKTGDIERIKPTRKVSWNLLLTRTGEI